MTEYEYGYSTSDDIDAVANWQPGNNIFVGLADGSYYVFARLIGSSSFLRYVVSVSCDGCTVAANGYFDITPNDCRVAASGYFDITEAIDVNEGILIIGIDV